MKRPALTAAVRSKLEKAARKAAKAAYAPYSGLRVGSAVLAKSGRIFSGCNVENSSYGMCVCAERAAIVATVSAGERSLQAVAIYTPTAVPTPPCGACRQVIGEFGPDALIISVCDSKKRIEAGISTLLPERFGPKHHSRQTKSRG
jgi:cytidine deaminase